MTSFVASPSSIWYALQTVIAAAVAAIFIMAIVKIKEIRQRKVRSGELHDWC